MLEPWVNNRYQSAQEVLDDLGKIIETVEPIESSHDSANISNIPPCKPTFVPPPIPPRRKRNKPKNTNKKLINKIAIIGPRPSGKFVYICTFAYFTNLVKNSPFESIISLNYDAKYLLQKA